MPCINSYRNRIFYGYHWVNCKWNLNSHFNCICYSHEHWRDGIPMKWSLNVSVFLFTYKTIYWMQGNYRAKLNLKPKVTSKSLWKSKYIKLKMQSYFFITRRLIKRNAPHSLENQSLSSFGLQIVIYNWHSTLHTHTHSLVTKQALKHDGILKITRKRKGRNNCLSQLIGKQLICRKKANLVTQWPWNGTFSSHTSKSNNKPTTDLISRTPFLKCANQMKLFKKYPISMNAPSRNVWSTIRIDELLYVSHVYNEYNNNIIIHNTFLLRQNPIKLSPRWQKAETAIIIFGFFLVYFD